MKAAIIKSSTSSNVVIEKINESSSMSGYVRVKPVLAGINPLDYNVISGQVHYNVNPFPHIPGSEIYGRVYEDSNSFKQGDRVIVYNRLFDNTCDYCIEGKEYLCRNGTIFGVGTNGGYAELISVKKENLIRIPQGISDNVAVSLPIAAATSYHALKQADAKAGQSILVFGASGNTGIFMVQLARIMGLDVHAVSRHNMADYGAMETYTMDSIPSNLEFDIVVNSLGGQSFSESTNLLKRGGTLVTFGSLNGINCNLNIASLYSREIKIIGTTGSSRKDMIELIHIAESNDLKVPVDSVYSLENISEALERFKTGRNGRVLLSFQ